MSTTKLNTAENFDNFIRSPTLTVVHFSADWADQCGQVNNVLDEISKLPQTQASNTKIGICDAENLSEISLKYKVDSVPTVMLFKNGVQVDRVDGADAAQITSKVKAHSAGNTISTTAPPLEVPSAKVPLQEKLKALVNRHKVMIFMKGSRDVPRCGFSRTLIQILNGIGVQYDTFDILTDEEVRQGLKAYSDWPTYPQVYVKGELIGGLDIIKEMQASGELESTLNA